MTFDTDIVQIKTNMQGHAAIKIYRLCIVCY